MVGSRVFGHAVRRQTAVECARTRLSTKAVGLRRRFGGRGSIGARRHSVICVDADHVRRSTERTGRAESDRGPPSRAPLIFATVSSFVGGPLVLVAPVSVSACRMLLLPSHIQTIYEDAVFSAHTVLHVAGPSSSSQDGAAPPNKKLQVFAKDGAYFALDHNLLKFYQTQEAQGLCSKIPVEVIPRRNIPAFVYEVAFCGSGPDDECYYGNDGSDSSSISERELPPEDVEDVTCAVCSHQFYCTKDLTDHQLLKRHFGCMICAETFTSFKLLQQHESVSGHGYWSNDNDAGQNAN